MTERWFRFCENEIVAANCVRRSDLTISAKTTKLVQQTIPKKPGWSCRCRAAGTFSFLLRTLPASQRYFSNHPASPGAVICAGIFCFRVLDSWWGVTLCEKRCLKACFLKSPGRLISKSYKLIKWESLDECVHVLSLCEWECLMTASPHLYMCKTICVKACAPSSWQGRDPE